MSTKTPLTLSLSKWGRPSPPGTPRELPDFLKRGDADLGAPRARYPGMQIGKGTLRAERVPEPLSGDALSAREWAVMVRADGVRKGAR
jgi:hypothetical protein